MGIRLQSEISDQYNQQYKVEIIDNEYSGAVIPFTTERTKWDLDFGGESKNILKEINPTTVKIPILIEPAQNNLDLENFIADLIVPEELRFFVKIYQKDKIGAAPGYAPIFIGNLVTDEVVIKDSARWDFQLTASDGLNRLTDQEFKSDILIPDQYGNDTYYYEGYEEIIKIIFKCLDGLGTQELYDDSQGNEFLWVNHHWYESKHANAFGSPLELIRISHRNFTRRDDEGNYITKTKAQVLKSVLAAIGCTIRYMWGTYWIENISSKSDVSKSFFVYTKTGTFVNKQLRANFIYDLDAQPLPKALQGGEFSFLEPLREVCVNLSLNLDNYGYTPDKWSNDEDNLVSLGDVYVEDENTAIFSSIILQWKYQRDLAFEAQSFHLWYGMTIKVNFGGTDYYYISTYEVVETQLEDDMGNVVVDQTITVFNNDWSTDPGVYLLKTRRRYLNEETLLLRDNWEFTTKPLVSIDGVEIEDIGELFVKIEFVIGPVDPSHPDDKDLFDGTFGHTLEWSTYLSYVIPISVDEFIFNQIAGIKYCHQLSEKNSSYLTIDTNIGDAGRNSNNRLEIFDGAEWVPSAEMWGFKSTTGTVKLQELLIQEIVSARPRILRRYTGAFAGTLDPRFLFKYKNVVYAFTKASFGFKRSLVQAEFYEVIREAKTGLEILINNIKPEQTGSISSVVGSSQDVTSPGAESFTAFLFEFTGANSNEFDFGEIILPSVTTITVEHVNYLVEIFRDQTRCWYKDPGGMTGYAINNLDNKIIFNRVVRDTEIIRGHVKIFAA